MRLIDFDDVRSTPLGRAITRLPRPLKRLVLYGQARECSFCGSQVRAFAPHGHPPRPNAWCPICGSVERHRMAWAFFQRRSNLFDGQPKRLLHLAPEQHFRARLQALPGVDYLSADLYDPTAMVRMDITDIHYPDGRFDVILCSHVLEHVPEDRRALAELYRVLAPGGWALFQVPIRGATTDEDATVTTPEARLARFGQRDHVRWYGLDLAERIAGAGFKTTVLGGADLFGREAMARMGAPDAEWLFLGEKQHAQPGG